MKVAILAGRFGRGTGTGGVAFRVARWLQQAGHEVAVWRKHGDEALEGVAQHPMGSRWTAARRVPAGWVRLALDRAPGCEVARASGGVHLAWKAVSGRWTPRDRWEALLDRATASAARAVICNSLRTAGEVMAFHRLAASRIHVVPSGVDPERYALPAAERQRARLEARNAWGVPEGGRVALFLGHGFRRKGLETAVLAFELASGPLDRLVVAGSDAHAGRWLRSASERLGPRLVVAGRLQAIERWLPGADAMLLPSRYDSAANATLEAMAAAVPPVVSARDGAAELVPERALVVGDPLDARGFARALRYAWEVPGLGARCATAAGRWPESRMMSAVEHLLLECAHG